jgi:branched-chain amino acid transport system permease protein
VEANLILQQIVGGLTIGAVYSLIALGFTMMLRASELINFAQGEMVMLGAFFGWTLYALLTRALPFWLTFLMGTALTGFFGILVEWLAFRPLTEKNSPLLNLIIATLGLFYILRSVAIIIWGADPLTYPAVVSQEPISAGNLMIQPLNLWILGLGILAMIGLQAFFKGTLTGISWRAASLDQETAAAMGVSTKKTIALTWGISSALGGGAGILVAPLYFCTYDMGWIAIKAFAAAAMGGFGIVGSILGGLVLGVVETLAAGIISSGYKDAISYGITAGFLVFFFRTVVPTGRSSGERVRTGTMGLIFPSHERRFPREKAVAIAGLLVFWLVIPTFVSDAYTVRILILAMINTIAAMGLQVIIGYTGQLSLAHAAFYGIGAYASALLILRVGLPFWLAFSLAPVVTGLGGWLVAPILRLSGHYLAIGTLALGQIIMILMINLKSITNGAYGISGIMSPRLGPWEFDQNVSFYYLATVITIIVYLVIRRVTDSRFGRALMAIRDNELAALGSGIDTLKYKEKAFVLGTGCAGIAGALYAHFMSFIDPNAFTVHQSIDMLIMVVIGGLGSIPGAVLGGFLVTLAPEYLRFLVEYRMIAYGLILVVFIRFLPKGLSGMVKNSFDYTMLWMERRLKPAANKRAY